MPADGSLYKLSPRRRAEIVCGKYAIGDTKNSKKFTIGGIADSDGYVHVSEAAYRLLKGTAAVDCGKKRIRHQGPFGREVRIEHVIPSELVFRHLDAIWERRRSLSVAYVEKLIGRLACAIITKKEDDKLNKAGLRSKMPDGCDFLSDNPFARYEAVGIKMHQW